MKNVRQSNVNIHKDAWVEINLESLAQNIIEIKKGIPKDKKFLAIVKADAYGHGMYIVNTLIKAGINYLAVSSINEAMDIRKYNKEIPILCTEVIEYDLISLAEENNITITEAGIFAFEGNGANQSSVKYYCIDREVFNPVIIKPGETYSFSITIK